MNLLFISSATRPTRPRVMRSAAVATATAVAVVGSAAAASAHVHVIPDATNSGATVQLTFRVPNESPKARFDRLVVTLPQKTPIPAVATRPLPGWTATITTGALAKPVTLDGTTLTRAPRTVTWTAARGQGVGQDQYQEFSMTAGPLPSPGELAFPTAQYYSDGTVVHWDEPTLEGKDEPEHPEPTFVVTASNGTDDPAPMVPAVSTAPAAAPSAGSRPATATGAPDGVARWLSASALAVAVAALGAALWRRRESRGPAPTGSAGPS